jgi:hypothetical protein
VKNGFATSLSWGRLFLPHISQIRVTKLSPEPRIDDVLGLRREIRDGRIVTVSTGIGQRVGRTEMIAAAMRTWEQAVIEEALGAEAARVLLDPIQLVG